MIQGFTFYNNDLSDFLMPMEEIARQIMIIVMFQILRQL